MAGAGPLNLARVGCRLGVHITYADIQPAWPALNILEDQFADDPRTSAWLDSELALITQAGTVHDGRTVIFLPAFGTVAAIARLRPAHPAVQELLTQAPRIEGQPWHAFHEWTELAAATTPDAQGFVNLAVEISRIVRINDMFPEYIHRPLTARLRRDTSLAAAVAPLVGQARHSELLVLDVLDTIEA